MMPDVPEHDGDVGAFYPDPDRARCQDTVGSDDDGCEAREVMFFAEFFEHRVEIDEGVRDETGVGETLGKN